MPDLRVQSSALLSDCGTYRYILERRWAGGALLTFVMLNPSTADAQVDDPTIRRCMGFARREGLAGVRVVNLYAYRSTDPKALLTCADPVGPSNDAHLSSVLRGDSCVYRPVVAAWGANARLDRVGQVLNLVPDVDWRCLGTTKQGAPKHPLYVKGDQPLVPYPWAVVTASRNEKQSHAPSMVDEVTFCDMGPVLSVWSHEGATLTADTARDLADALRAWADKAARRAARSAS